MANPKTICSTLFYTDLENPTHMNYLKKQATLKYLKLVKKYLGSFNKLNAAVKEMTHIKDENNLAVDIVFADQCDLFDQEGNIKNSDEHPDNIHTREYGDGTIYTSIAQSDGSMQDFKIDWNHSNHLKLIGTDKQHPISDREFIIMTSILEMAENEVIKPYRNILKQLKTGHSYTPYEDKTIVITDKKKQQLSLKVDEFIYKLRDIFTDAFDLSELKLITPNAKKISKQLDSTLSQKVEAAKQQLSPQLSNTLIPLFLKPPSELNKSSSLFDYDDDLVILLVGDTNSSKSALSCHIRNINKPYWTNNFFLPDGFEYWPEQKITIIRHKTRLNVTVRTPLCDERSKTIQTKDYRGTMAVLLTYSVTCEQSFKNLRHWYDNIRDHAKKIDITIIGVAKTTRDNNKRNKVIHLHHAQKFAKEIGASGCYEYCLQTNVSIKQLFHAAVDKTYHRLILPCILQERNSLVTQAKKNLESEQVKSTLSQKIAIDKQQLTNTSKPLFLTSDPGSHGTMVPTVSSSSSSHYDYLIKILLIGDANTYKSPLLLRFSDSNFSLDFIYSRGIDFQQKTIQRHEKQFKLQICSTEGQERYIAVSTDYYRGTQAILLTYNVTCEKSFGNLRNWYRNIEHHASERVNVIIVGIANTRSDKHERRVISYERAQAFADEYRVKYYECCLETGKGVNKPFLTAVDDVYDKYKLLVALEKKERENVKPEQPSNCTLS